MSFNSESIADFENLISLENTIKSSQVTRWERKAQQQNNQNNDRFIPNRSGMEKVLEQSTLDEAELPENEMDKSLHVKVLANSSGLTENYSNTRILAFKNKAPAPKDGYQSSLKVLYSQQTTKKAEVAKPTRQISSAPLRILDAPDLKDDYYLNLMSWSASNVLAIALSSTLYLWDAASGKRGFLILVNETSIYSFIVRRHQGAHHASVRQQRGLHFLCILAAPERKPSGHWDIRQLHSVVGR